MGDVVNLAFGRTKAGRSLPKPRDCEACEDPIETARLQVNPQARRCTACETARERRHQRQMQAARDRDIVIIRG
jgi:hypothetical protein